jgi:hypothetical protein
MSILSNNFQNNLQYKCVKGNESSYKPIDINEGWVHILANIVKHYYLLNLFSKKNPVIKFNPCVYPTLGKVKAKHFRV